jgi:hypothetical protein
VTYYSLQSPGVPVGYAPAGLPLGMPSGALSGPVPGGIGQPSTEALRQQAAALIQRCYRWLEAVAPAQPRSSTLVPAMITAVQQYEARQYTVSLNQASAVAATIRLWQGSF